MGETVNRKVSRRRFGTWLALSAALGSAVREASARQDGALGVAARRMPCVFVGHGSPMNAIADNSYTRSMNRLGQSIGKPVAIVVVSAHWMTESATQISTATQMETIHDFGGFPQALYDIRYPAAGSPATARQVAGALAGRANGVSDRGLDHGAWTVLKHMYPDASVPCLQVSMNASEDPDYHVMVGKALGQLRSQGVLVLCSGNVVHNLGATMRGAADSAEGLTPWAQEFDQQIKECVHSRDMASLTGKRALKWFREAHPYPDHYVPLLYAMGASSSEEKVTQVFEGFQAGTLSMRCMRWD